ncbi:MAG: hypothetical protein MJ237_03480 [bacterium]|nr:hypothetical protein [bacterium]
MKKYKKLLLALSAASKVITKPEDAETIKTIKNITKDHFNKLSVQHLLGKTRLGVTPEILGQEDKVMFGGIDIDCQDISHEEKYNIALDLQDKLFEDYRLKAVIETSKSKGFHVWMPFGIPQERIFIKNILQDVISTATDKKIANGEIEVFPKGDKGNAIFLPFYGMFKDENTIDVNYYAQMKNVFVEGKNMEAIQNPLEAIHQAMRQNDSMLPILKEFSIYPKCIRKALFVWKKGDRHYLSMAIAAILKKVCKASEAEAISLIKSIAQFNCDEEINDRISAVKSTYRSEEIAGCSIMQGKNENIAITNVLCSENCDLIEKSYTVKDKVRKLQANNKGLVLKEKVAELIKSIIDESGKMFRSNCKFYLFLKDEKQLIALTEDSREFKNLLTKWGINASETLFKYVKEELYVHCAEHATDVNIHKFAYFNSENYALYIYNASNSILKVTENSVTTIENGDEGVLFEELNDYTPFKLVDFDKGKNYLSEYLIKNLNLESDEYNIDVFKLVEIWFYSLFFESIMPTKPIFVLIGEKGSGKTSFLRRSGQILMGEKFNVTSITSDYKNLITLITNNYFVVIDNLDSPTTQINDTLARISTGQVIKIRDYYTTNQQVDFEAKCFVALTSRKPHFTRDDVSDRLICVFLKRFESFESENKLKANTSKKRDEIMSYIISQVQIIISNLKKNKGKIFKTSFRMADFAEFAFKMASSEKEIKQLEDMFSSLSRQQKDFAIRDDIVYIILKEIVGEKWNQGTKFSTTSLLEKFRNKAEELGLERIFNSLYINPKSLTSHLMNIKDNISNEIIIDRQKAHGNAYVYSFYLVDETKPISQAQAIEMLMNKSIEELTDAYDKYMNKEGGKDE